jgi:hypothetical protein
MRNKEEYFMNLSDSTEENHEMNGRDAKCLKGQDQVENVDLALGYYQNAS